VKSTSIKTTCTFYMSILYVGFCKKVSTNWFVGNFC
jgi:hypothetical protein